MEPHDIIRENKSVYNTIASEFSSTRQYLWNDLKPLVRFLPTEGTLLDIGCGNGRLYQMVQNSQVKYIGVDQSDKLIDIAKKQFPEGRFIVQEMSRMSLPAKTADIIFSIAAFHHLPSHQLRIQGLKEMKRLLKPGGRVIMLNWNLYSDYARDKGWKVDEQGGFWVPWKDASGAVVGSRYYHGFLLEELHEVADEAGFKIEEQYYTKDGEVSSMGPGDNILTVLTLR